jgi:23S rRNA G2445 N2-methylase RlmL
MIRWNSSLIRQTYESWYRTAQRAGFTIEELETPTLDRLSHQTKSLRILRMVKLAYHLGVLRGIRSVDEMSTPIVPSTPGTGDNLVVKPGPIYRSTR